MVITQTLYARYAVFFTDIGYIPPQDFNCLETRLLNKISK